MTNATSGLVLKQVRIGLNGCPLLSIDCAIDPGEILTVMGPSGSGKSSLIAYIGGFLDPVFEASGKIMLCGMDISEMDAADRHVGILFQDALLFPHMSVLGNLLFAIPQDVTGSAQRHERASAALAGVELAGFENRDPETLSGGQKARVALARVLLSQPRMLLLDEPFSKLDTGLRSQMREIVFQKARDQNLPVLLVTHDLEDARAAGGHIVRLDEDR